MADKQKKGKKRRRPEPDAQHDLSTGPNGFYRPSEEVPIRSIASMYSVSIPGDEDKYQTLPIQIIKIPEPLRGPEVEPGPGVAEIMDMLKSRPTNMGWECPVCHKCYAPWAPDCETCGKEKK